MKFNKLRRLHFNKLKRLKLKKLKRPKVNDLKRQMESRMESFKQKGRLSRRFSSKKSLGSLKTRFKKFVSDHHGKAGEAEDNSSGSSDSDTEGRKTSSPIPRSGEIKKFSSSSSSDSDEGSPSKRNKDQKTDSSSDSSSSEKKRKRDPSKSSSKKLQLLLEKDLQGPFRLPTLEETPPSSPRENRRFSTGAITDVERLWKHASAPNSPANLAHNLNLNYRGGASSPVALIHSLSTKEPGKQATQLSEISFASPPSSSSLDFDVLGARDDLTASPSKATPSLKPNELPIVHHDEEQGVWRCGSCGWVYPNPNPSLRNRGEHKKHCGEITNVQRWLGSQDIQDAPEKGAVESEGDLEEWKGPRIEEELKIADEHPMEKFDKEDSHESASDRSIHHPATEGVNEIDLNVSPEHHAFGDEGNDEKKPATVETSDKVEDQKVLNRVDQWPTLDSELKDQSSSRSSSSSSSSERLSNGSNTFHEIDQSKLEGVSNGSSTAPHGIEETHNLDDSVDKGPDRLDAPGGPLKMTPEAENEKEEPVETEADLEETGDDVGSQQKVGSEVETHESRVSQNSEEEEENQVRDVQMHSVNGNEKLEKSGQHSNAEIHANGHDIVHDDNTAGLNEEEDSANQDFSNYLGHHEETELNDVPEIHNEPSVLPSDNGHGTDDLEKDDLHNDTPTDDESSKQSRTVKEVEKGEPRDLADKDWPNYKAKVVKAMETTEPGLSIANVQDEKDTAVNGDDHDPLPVPDADNKIDEMDYESVGTGNEERGESTIEAGAPDVTKDRVVAKLAERSYSQKGYFGKEEDVKYNGFEFPDDSTQPRVTEIDSVEGNLVEVSPAQESGNRTEHVGRLAGPPSPLEEAPKWVNSLMLSAQEEGDTFSTRQKYWADRTRSEYLLVEGKRSPSSNKGDDVGFPSVRIGEGRRSPSPFSLSKSEQDETRSSSPSPVALNESEQGEIESSSPTLFSLSKSEQGEILSSSPVVLASYHSTVEDNNENRGNPSVAVVQHEGSSSSSAHMENNFEQAVHEQNTHDMICPVCGSDVTKRIILKKRKRTLVPEDDERLPEDDVRLPKAVMFQQGGLDQAQEVQTVESDDEAWGCLGCLSLFIRSREGRVTKAVVPGAEGELIGTEQEEVRCLPLPIRWRPWTSVPELNEPLLSETARDNSRAREDAEEKRSWNCLPELLPAFTSWGPISVYDVEFSLDKEESPGALSSDQENISAAEGQEEATSGSPEGEISEPIPVGAGRIRDVPLDDDEQVSCFSYLHSSKAQLLADYKGEKDVGELAKPTTVTVSRAPLDDDEQVSCLSYLERANQYLEDSGSGAVQGIDLGPSVKGDAPGESSTQHLEAKTEGKAPKLIEQVEEKREVPGKEQGSAIQLQDDVGVSQPVANNARESEEKGKCECLPLFSFMSENSFLVHRVTGVAAPSKESVQADSGGVRDFHPVEDPIKEGGSDFLPASVPAFTWGTSSKYDLPPSPGVQSSREEIGSVIEGHEEATPARAIPSVTREPQALEDAEEKRNWNCLPELLPAFSWGPIPVYDVQYSVDTDKSPGILSSDQENITVVEGEQEATGGSPTTSLTQEPQSVEDAGEKGSCNCLPELPPAFWWGQIPVVDNTYLPPSISGDDNSEKAASLSGTAGHIPEVLLDDDEADLPDLKGKRVVDGIGSNAGIFVEKTEDSLGPKRNSDHTRSHLESVSKEEATCSCLPIVLPAIHWGWTKTTKYDNGLQQPLYPKGSDQGIEPPAAEPVPLEDSSSTDLKQTAETSAYPIARVPGHSTSSLVDFNEGVHTTESKDLHIEGTVTSHNTVTETGPIEQPTEVNVVESHYHFEVDIQDGHFTSTVEKLPPKLPELEISNGEADSSTVAESSVSSATSSDGPEQAHVPGDLEDTGAEISEERLGEHLAKAIAAQQNQEIVVTSAGIVPKPLKRFLSSIFPAVEIEDETEAKGTVEQKSKLENDWYNCLPVSVKSTRWWRPSMDYKVGEGLEEHLLDKVEENEDGTSTDMAVAPRRNLPEDRTGERCSCLPALPKFSMYDVFRDHHISPEQPLPGTEVDDISGPLLGTTPPKTETVVNIYQRSDQIATNVTVTGPTTEEAAAEAIATAQGQSPSETAGTSQEYLKSIVHGGLDVTLVSLGVVASAAGGDAKTITVIAIGLANLVFGLITHLGTIMSLYYNNRPKFVEDIGQGFVHGCLSFISFLFFGALAPITYGFSFRNATNRDYKFASTCVVALVCIVLLGAAQAHVKSKSVVRVISLLIVTGFVAVTAGYETGNYVSQLLKYFEFDSV